MEAVKLQQLMGYEELRVRVKLQGTRKIGLVTKGVFILLRKERKSLGESS